MQDMDQEQARILGVIYSYKAFMPRIPEGRPRGGGCMYEYCTFEQLRAVFGDFGAFAILSRWSVSRYCNK